MVAGSEFGCMVELATLSVSVKRVKFGVMTEIVKFDEVEGTELVSWLKA